jgi:phosphoglycolate phosphatase
MMAAREVMDARLAERDSGVAPLADLAESPPGFDRRCPLPALASLKGATVAFDLDGTLVDTAPDLIACLNAILVDEGLAAMDLSSARNLVGHGARVMIEHGFANAGRPLDETRSRALVDRFIPIYLERIAEESAPFPGCTEALDILRAAGAKLCVCTNKLTNLSEALLEALGLAAYFEAIVGPDATTARKPDPRHLLDAISAAGGDRAVAVYVGDSRPDAQAARGARVPSIGVTFGYTDVPVAELGFDALIDGYGELSEVCARLLDGRG